MTEFAKMVRNDVAHRLSDESVEAYVHEDIIFGLEVYCKHAMQQLDAFGKKKLRANVASMLEQKFVIEMPVVTEKGAIVAFNKMDDGVSFWRCSFIVALQERDD